SPIKFSDLEIEVKPSPVLGEHTDEILQELGFKIDDLIDLRHKKVI
ncbi:MAG: formyl-CoA transferase, partial [Burkholderiaceae bacterium]|nr:formyl-CoA transferase [Burkholderiaceae bacterium]